LEHAGIEKVEHLYRNMLLVEMRKDATG